MSDDLPRRNSCDFEGGYLLFTMKDDAIVRRRRNELVLLNGGAEAEALIKEAKARMARRTRARRR